MCVCLCRTLTSELISQSQTGVHHHHWQTHTCKVHVVTLPTLCADTVFLQINTFVLSEHPNRFAPYFKDFSCKLGNMDTPPNMYWLNKQEKALKLWKTECRKETLIVRSYTSTDKQIHVQYTFILHVHWLSSQIEALWSHHRDAFKSVWLSVCFGCVYACLSLLCARWLVRIVTLCVTSCSISSYLLSLPLTSVLPTGHKNWSSRQDFLHVLLYKCAGLLLWQNGLSLCHLSCMNSFCQLHSCTNYVPVSYKRFSVKL